MSSLTTSKYREIQCYILHLIAPTAANSNQIGHKLGIHHCIHNFNTNTSIQTFYSIFIVCVYNKKCYSFMVNIPTFLCIPHTVILLSYFQSHFIMVRYVMRVFVPLFAQDFLSGFGKPTDQLWSGPVTELWWATAGNGGWGGARRLRWCPAVEVVPGGWGGTRRLRWYPAVEAASGGCRGSCGAVEVMLEAATNRVKKVSVRNTKVVQSYNIICFLCNAAQ
jgi:hypothetical protein